MAEVLVGLGWNNCGQFDNYKLIYRRYAGLFFIFAVDVDDNELLMMETIHLFVELLDQYFSNVCELDIVFNFNKVCTGRGVCNGLGGRQRLVTRAAIFFLARVFGGQVYAILDEYVLAGEVQETSKLQILSRIRDMEKLE